MRDADSSGRAKQGGENLKFESAVILVLTEFGIRILISRNRNRNSELLNYFKKKFSGFSRLR